MHSFETFSFFLPSFLRQIAFAAASLPPRRIRYTERQRALPLRSYVAQSAKFSPSLPPSQNLRSPLLPRRRPTEKMKPGGRARKREPLLPSREEGGLSLRSEARTVSLRHPAKRARGAFTKSPKFKAQIAARNRRTERGASLSLASARRVDYRTNSFHLKNSPLSSPSLRSSVPSPAESLSRQYYCTIVERAAEERSKKRGEGERSAFPPLSHVSLLFPSLSSRLFSRFSLPPPLFALLLRLSRCEAGAEEGGGNSG